MNEVMRRISHRLSAPDLTQTELDGLYTELSTLNAELRRRDSERRAAPVQFSNGLELPAWKIAQYCSRYSVADFCVLFGLSRAEVLERTGLGKAGVQ